VSVGHFAIRRRTAWSGFSKGESEATELREPKGRGLSGSIVVRLLSLWILCAVVLFSSPCAQAEVLFKVPWGTGPGQIGYYNQHSAGPGQFDQPYGEGPGGIAIGPDNEIWISDQWNNRILRFTREGKLVGTVARLGGAQLAHPLSLWVSGKKVVVVNRTDQTIFNYDLSTKKLVKLGGYGSGPGQLLQAEMVIGTPQGNVWVGDFMASKLIHFGPDGKEIERRPWGLDGFSVNATGELFTLDFHKNSQGLGEHYLISNSPTGQKKELYPLSAPELQAPLLVGLDTTGGPIVRFVKPGTTKKFLLVHYDAKGLAGKPLGETSVGITTQQFVVTPTGSVIGLSFDPTPAPQGSVEVVEFKRP